MQELMAVLNTRFNSFNALVPFPWVHGRSLNHWVVSFRWPLHWRKHKRFPHVTWLRESMLTGQHWDPLRPEEGRWWRPYSLYCIVLSTWQCTASWCHWMNKKM